MNSRRREDMMDRLRIVTLMAARVSMGLVVVGLSAERRAATA
jgi:hypothetical protein